MRRALLTLLAAGSLSWGCRPAADGPPAGPRRVDRCGVGVRPWPEVLERVRKEAVGALRLADYNVDRVYDAEPVPAPRPLVGDGRRRRAVLSFPEASAGDPLHGRSFVYDDALALLWFTSAGDEESARALAATLVSLQNEDGTWGFSFSVEEPFYNAGYVRSGTVAWAAHALATFAARWADHGGAAAAARAGQALLAARRTEPPGAGLIEGGRGRWSEGGKRFFPEFHLRAAITEHQLDAQMALSSLDRGAARGLGERILDGLWLEGEGRFGVAIDKEGTDAARALDAAGGWGALWLAAQGDTTRARRSLSYTVRAFAARAGDDGLAGYRPYLDPIEGAQSALDPELVFVEGTLGVALAAHRLGEPAVAESALRTVAALACLHGPGVPVANRAARDFVTTPAAAPTLWFLFAEREIDGGVRAPVFTPPGEGR